ncbi:MAG: AMP-binding protein [Lawsonella sp.]
MAFKVETLYEGNTISQEAYESLTSFLDIAEQRIADIAAGEIEDYVIYRFFDYLNDPEGAVDNPDVLTWTSFVTRTKAIGARLQQVCEPGDRVIIMMPQNLDYVTGFSAPLFSGQISIPAFSPTEPAHAGYLEAVLTDAKPKVILTNAQVAGPVREFLKGVHMEDKPRIIAVEGIEDGMAKDWKRPDIDPEGVAYLQYSSGSTRRPTASRITHRGSLLNVLQLFRGVNAKPHLRCVDWIPIFHTMSIVYIHMVPISWASLDIMEPAAMLQQPSRWVKAWQSVDGEDVFSSGPDFAFGLAATRGKPAEGEELDLSNVIALMNGSESVTQGTVDSFNSTFMPYGLGPNVLRPSYGNSEATCVMAAPAPDVPTHVAMVDGTKLAEGQFVEMPAGEEDQGIPQVGVGQPLYGQWAVIVKAEFDENEEFTGRGSEVPDGVIGEIWMAGPNKADGYWGLDQETKETFHNELVQVLPDGKTHTVQDGKRVPEGTTWLRTGDMGAYYKGQLYITGRVKDLIIVDGRNHVSNDIESTFNAAASNKFAANSVAAFSVSAAEVLDSAQERTGRQIPDDAKGEQLVIVAEENPEQPVEDFAELLGNVRALVARRHGIQLADLRIVNEGAIPRTPTGKIKRKECSEAYKADELETRF